MNRLKNYGTFTQWNTMHLKEEGIPTLCDSMDGTGDYYAKWIKPVGKRQIPYDHTYKRSLIHKIN